MASGPDGAGIYLVETGVEGGSGGSLAFWVEGSSPAWAPDGCRIAYISNASDYWHDDLWVVDTETLESRQISLRNSRRLATAMRSSRLPAWYCARTSSSASERPGCGCGGGAGRDRTRG